MKCSRIVLLSTFALVLAVTGPAFGAWPPAAGDTGSIAVNSPYSQNGAQASLWGFYAGPSGWVNTTFGTGTFAGGSATVNYTVPANFVSNFYWNVTVYYSTTSDERGQYYDLNGAWGQFFTNNPNGQTVNVSVYQFDQRKVTTSAASFRASVLGGTVFPPAATTTGYVTVRTPWTGTMAQFTAPTGGYYTYPKTSLLPTRLASRGFFVDVLEGNPAATQEFQKIRLHNTDYSYSVDLFGYKNLSGDDPLGYLWWTTLVDVQSAACTYNGVTGVFSGTFATPLSTGVMYFVVPEFDVMDSVASSLGCWVQAGRGTDLLLSGASFQANVLSLDPTPASIYVKPGEQIIVDMNVANLAQKVNACQALLGYSSEYLNVGSVAAGGGVWDELIYETWAVSGEINTAIGVDAQGSVGTDADGTVAKITVTAKSKEGTTQMVFLPDVSDVKGTFLSDMSAQPVLPAKVNSVDIYVDGTNPTVNSFTAAPLCTKTTTTLTFTVSDDNSGVGYVDVYVEAALVAHGVSSPYVLDMSGYATETCYNVTIKVVDKAGNETDSSPVSVCVDKTAPVISSITATQVGNDVLCPEGAVQGVVDIYVTATDAGCADLVVPPTVAVAGIAPVSYIGVAGDIYHYQVTVLSTTSNGSHTITVDAADGLGNTSSDGTEAICVDKNQVTGTVSFATLSSTSYSVTRDVVFVATDTSNTALKTWTVSVAFTNAGGTASGEYALRNVPGTMTHLSAKTAWSLRKRLDASLDGNGQTAVSFTLLGGDINGTNSVNILDYSILKTNWLGSNPAADINGSGAVNVDDYNLMKGNWFKAGDPQ